LDQGAYDSLFTQAAQRVTNGNDVVHGRPLLIKENPLTVKNNEYAFVLVNGMKYTLMEDRISEYAL